MQLVIHTDGSIFTREAGGDSLNQQYTPASGPAIGAAITASRSSFAVAHRCAFVNGRFSPALVWYEISTDDGTVGFLRRAGIQPWDSAPSSTGPLKCVKGSGGYIDGFAINYVSICEKYISASGTELVLTESSLSPGSTMESCSSSKYTWTFPSGMYFDQRMLTDSSTRWYWRIYRSIDGDVPSWVADIPIVNELGDTTYTDSLDEAARGMEVPVYADGSVIPSSRDLPRYCAYAIQFQRRVFIAGDPEYPYRLYYSLIGEAECFPPSHYVDTLGHEAITGLSYFGDNLLVHHANGFYTLTGYGEDDFVLHKVSDGAGCISHHSIAFDEYGRPWWASAQGPLMFDGQIHRMGDDVREYWEDHYAANREKYEDSVGVVDFDAHCYILLLPETGSTTYTRSWVTNYQNLLSNAQDMQPAWSFDIVGRGVNAHGNLYEDGQIRKVFYGGADGVLRISSKTAVDDAGVEKTWLIRHGHFPLHLDQSGPTPHGGGMVTEATLFLDANKPYTVKAWGGDDGACEAGTPTWGPYEFAAHSKTGKTRKASKYLAFRKGLQGTGVTVELSGTGAAEDDIEYRGLNLGIASGVKTRGSLA